MNRLATVNKLFKIANTLDLAGYKKEADIISDVMSKIANKFDDEYMKKFDPANDPDNRTPGRSEMFEADLPGEVYDMDDDSDTTKPTRFEDGGFDDENDDELFRVVKEYLMELEPNADVEDVEEQALDFIDSLEDRAKRMNIDKTVVFDDEEDF